MKLKLKLKMTRWVAGFVVIIMMAAVGSLAQEKLARLTPQLSATSARARAQAACGLGRLGFRAETAIPALVSLLGDGTALDELDCHRGGWRSDHERETSPGQQAAIALADIGNASFAPLVSALGDVSWTVRKNAALGLGHLEDERAVAPLVARLEIEDDMPVVREQTAWALGRIESRDATAALASTLQKDAHEKVREQAAWALGKVEDPIGVAPLVEALTDSSARVREQSAWALGKLDARDAVPGLSRAVSDSDAGVREQASWALGKDRRPGSASGVDRGHERQLRKRARAGCVGARPHRRRQRARSADEGTRR